MRGILATPILINLTLGVREVAGPPGEPQGRPDQAGEVGRGHGMAGGAALCLASRTDPGRGMLIVIPGLQIAASALSERVSETKGGQQ